LPQLRNYNVLVQESEQEVVFLHRIAPGSAERSYGIHVAKLAGVPLPVLRRATAVLHELESRHHLPTSVGEPTSIIERRRRRGKAVGPSLFGDGEAAGAK
jgi:DNA mismatch repair protein MutS